MIKGDPSDPSSKLPGPAQQSIIQIGFCKYLTFSLHNEEYGIGILKIKEIIGMMSITKVPRTPVFVKGVINLRGKVIPVNGEKPFDIQTFQR